MTSKNSFLASIKENNKRRLWVWMLSALFFVLAIPVEISITISRQMNSLKLLTDTYGAAFAGEAMRERLINSMCGQLGFSSPLPVLTTIIAVSAGIQGFSYLYSRKKIDFYMGMPVKRSKRFLIIWLNGIILYVLPYFLGLLISLLIAAGNGAVDGRVLFTAFAALGVNIIYYLSVYHMAILALMLTGNLVITGFGFFVFCFYEYMVRYMLQGYRSLFFKYFSYHSMDVAPKVSPFMWYTEIADTFSYKNIINIKYFAALLVFALVIGVISYACYLKRPAEAAGKAMTFQITKPVIKILLTVPMALLIGGVIADMVDYEPATALKGGGYVIFSLALVVVIGSGLIQSIYEFDIKGMVHKKSHIVLSGVITALIFLVFRYDLFGYDAYVPKPEKIESVAFIPSDYETIYGGGARFDEKGEYLSEEEYAKKYMHLTNAEDVCELASLSMEAYNFLSDTTSRADAMVFAPGNKWSTATLLYRLKNGREVYRRIWVNVENEQTAELLDRIIGSDEFKRGYLPGAAENLMGILENTDRYKVGAAYGNTVYWEELAREEIKEFIQVYQKDLARANFSNVKENLPVGMGRITISEEIKGRGYGYFSGSEYAYSTRSWDVAMNVYPFYEDTIAWLKEHGYYMEFQLNREDVEHIQIMNHNTEAYNELMQKQSMEAGAVLPELAGGDIAAPSYAYGYHSTLDYEEDTIDTRVYADYTDEEAIDEIVARVYPGDMVEGDWDFGVAGETDYTVYIYFKADSPITRKYGSSMSINYMFPEGQVPDFVKEDTLYKN